MFVNNSSVFSNFRKKNTFDMNGFYSEEIYVDWYLSACGCVHFNLGIFLGFGLHAASVIFVFLLVSIRWLNLILWFILFWKKNTRRITNKMSKISVFEAKSPHKIDVDIKKWGWQCEILSSISFVRNNRGSFFILDLHFWYD